MSDSRTLTDHDEIKDWADSRKGHPAMVKATAGSGDGAGVLRIDFGDDNDNLDRISWDTWFETFDDQKLALLVQDKTADGETSRFNKLISRD